VLLILLLAAMGVQATATLGGEVVRRNLPAPPEVHDLEQAITSYAVLDDERGFVIGYYAVEPDGSLHELRVRAFDNGSRTWRLKTFDEPIGSVLSIQRGGRFLYVTGHSSPSAAPLLVLEPDLALKRTLDGWPELVLPDGRVLFHRSMVHFAPTHAAVLALYDPVADREVNVYPANAARIERGIERDGEFWVDRAIDFVKEAGKPATIEFKVVEQRMRLAQNDRAVPASPEQRFTVVCDLAARVISCARR
jgi:hypothetical protein